MILVFAGAGASTAVDPDQYPTTVKFLERVPLDVKSNPWFEHAFQFLSTRENSSPIDIEHILDVLSVMQGYCLKSHDDTTFPGWMLADGRFAGMANTRIMEEHLIVPSLVDFMREMENEGIRLAALQGDIHSLVYQYYERLPASSELANWMTLLETVTDPYRGLEIFTTNYDRVLEQVVHVSEQIVLNIPNAKEMVTGRRHDGMQTWLDLTCWDTRQVLPEGNRVRLTKLHGSVDWQRSRDGKIVMSNPVYTGNDQHHILLYPGHKGEPREEPFITFHNHLRLVAQQADAAIFIGYAFRDEYINQILSNLPPRIPKYVVNQEQPLPNLGFLDGAMHFDYGFTEQSVTECIGDLRKHKLALTHTHTHSVG